MMASKFSKSLALILALAMTLTLLAACNGGTPAGTTTAKAGGTTTAAGTGTLDAVTLTWYNGSNAFAADAKSVNQDVAAALNKYFKEKINVTVDYKWFSQADFTDKATAAINAGQPMDITFTTSGVLPFTIWQKAGAFADLTELLPAYAPVTYASIPEWVWGAASIEGRIYAMPTYKDVAVNHPLLYNKSLTQELGLDEELVNLKWSVMPDLDEYFTKIKTARDAAHPDWAKDPIIKLPDYSKGKTLSPYIQGDNIVSLVWTSIPGTTSLAGAEYADGTKAVNIFTTDDYMTAMLMNKKWVSDGLAPYDQTNWDKEGVVQKSGKMLGWMSWGVVAVDENQYENFKFSLVQPQTAFTYTGYPRAVMQAISADSKNKERSMMLLELVFSDQYVSTCLRFGEEGKGWNRITIDGVERAGFKGTYNEVPADRKDKGFYLWYHAEQGNLFTCLLPESVLPTFYVNLQAMNESAAVSPNMGFSFDTANVVNEIAAVTSVIDEFQTDIFYGMLDDVPGRIEAFNTKLNANGAEKLIAEVQTQLDAWHAAQ